MYNIYKQSVYIIYTKMSRIFFLLLYLYEIVNAINDQTIYIHICLYIFDYELFSYVSFFLYAFSYNEVSYFNNNKEEKKEL